MPYNEDKLNFKEMLIMGKIIRFIAGRVTFVAFKLPRRFRLCYMRGLHVVAYKATNWMILEKLKRGDFDASRKYMDRRSNSAELYERYLESERA
jgi:hypothetical protein